MQTTKLFYAWWNRTKIEKLLCNRVVKFVKRLLYLEMAHGFSQISHYHRSSDERLRERKEFGNKTIQGVLGRLIKYKLADALHSLKNRAYKRDFKEKFLQRAFKHSLMYRMRHYYGKWKHVNDKAKLAELVNVRNLFSF